MSKKNKWQKTQIQAATPQEVQRSEKIRIWKSFDHFWNDAISGASPLIKTAFRAHLVSKKALENQALWVPEAIKFGIEIEE